MQTCSHCIAFLKKTNQLSKIDLTRSFTKINDVLHLGFNRPQVCPTLASYIPDTVVLAGNGAVEMKDGGDCWTILKKELMDADLLGPADQGKYQDGLDALTWIAAHCDFFGKTIKPEAAQELILGIKTKVIRSLHQCKTLPREMNCSACAKQLPVLDSKKLLILTTNWDLYHDQLTSIHFGGAKASGFNDFSEGCISSILPSEKSLNRESFRASQNVYYSTDRGIGLFNNFKNVIQLHGRCDYAEQAVLPLQNISALMARTIEDLEKLNCGILPGPFLQECLAKTKHFIFWGTKLNDYDVALWHFLRGFLKANTNNVQLGMAARNAEGFKKGKERIERFFPSIPIQDCLCHMLPISP